ncbi:LAFA_0G23992g1_1 [Lachancea sp. 'fantastica']|nr:LAFA_0G23992g1_1 [Lachancea sp. 'fantastica']
MGGREAKKRGPSPFASPERLCLIEESIPGDEKASAVSSGTNKRASRIKKKYKFTPLDTISDKKDKNSVQPGSLRSISLSQVRKSTIDKSYAARFSRDDAAFKATVALRPLNGVQETDSKLHKDTNRPEEVVWQYSPKKNTRSDAGSELDHEYRSLSEDSVVEQAVKESSTPIVPNKYRNVLNLRHVDQVQGEETASLASRNPSLQKNSLPRSYDNLSPSRPSTRDIDEIINDLECHSGLKPPFQAKDIPSSPTLSFSERAQVKDAQTNPQMHITKSPPEQISRLQKENQPAYEVIRERSKTPNSLLSSPATRVSVENTADVQKGKSNHEASINGAGEAGDDDARENEGTNDNSEMNNDNDDESEDDDDEDCSLIEILTQKFGASESNKHTAASSKSISNSISNSCDLSSDDAIDDSLLELLQSADKTPTTALHRNEELESEIQVVEQQFSQTLNVKEQNLEKPNIGEDLLERAQFAAHRKDMNRLVIVEIEDHHLRSSIRQKVLKCVDSESKISNLVVRTPWVDLPFERGDVVHTIPGRNSVNKRLFSNDKEPGTEKLNDNLLILNPDILLAATTIGKAVECQRKSIIATQFNGPGEASLPALIGSIVHELLQACLQYKLDHHNLPDDFVNTKLKSLLEYYAADITLCQTTQQQLSEQIAQDHLMNIKEFTRKYVKSQEYVKALGRNKVPFEISNIIDIEENIWSPMYGLKGFIDATVETRFPNNSRYISPLELKTGKTKAISHEVQGSIYTLLLNDRYELPVNFFLLFYTKSNDFSKQNTLLTSIKHLLVLRNRVSAFLKHELKEIAGTQWNGTILPPILRSSECDKCYSKTECMVLNKLCDDGNAADSGLKDGEYDAITSHLQENKSRYKDFYMKYEDLIVKEESSLNGVNRKVFLLDSRTRESVSGKCLSSLRIKSSEDYEFNKQILYTFVRKDGNSNLPLMTASQLSVNDIVIISDESGHFALCTGRVTVIARHEITVMTSRRIENNNIHVPGFEKETNQTLRTVLIPTSEPNQTRQDSLSYRIDRNEVQRGMAMARFNLLNLFLPPVPKGSITIDEVTGKEIEVKPSLGGDMRSREFLIDDKAPKFRSGSDPPVVNYKDKLSAAFNVDQQAAFNKVMRAEDFALILGMPGTGKTTLIVEIVRTLIGCGKSVLLTSYTHSAIDNILIKLKQYKVDILRLGAKHRVHRETQEFIPDLSAVKSFSELVDLAERAPVVATTCLNIYDTLFSVRRKDFDYVIVDEASQLSLPMCLGPLKFAPKFVLVGDHYQLPPLVKNSAARAGGLDESLFKILCEKHPNSMVELTYQYRMCEDIMTLPNYLIYDGKLKCGNEEVRKQELNTPTIADLMKLQRFNASDTWLVNVIEKKRKVIFLDHDECSSCQETGERDNITNLGEAEVVWQCVAGLVKSGVQRKDIGIMTLYRAQLRLLRAIFSGEEDAELEILTADQFQGRDKKCVIISMVRSNDGVSGGSLLRELRRVNVAMTRAKAKLLIVGSKRTISSVDTIRGFMELLETRGWIYTLPADCLQCYNLPRKTGSKRSTSQQKKTSLAILRATQSLHKTNPLCVTCLMGCESTMTLFRGLSPGRLCDKRL